MSLTLKEAVEIATANKPNALNGEEKGVRHDDLSSLSSSRADELASAFGRMLNPLLKLDAAFKGVDIEALKGSTDDEVAAYNAASDYLTKEAPSVVASLGLEKAFLAFKDSSYSPKSQTLAIAIGKILADNVQSTSDIFTIDTGLFNVTFGQAIKSDIDVDEKAFKKFIGLDVKKSILNSLFDDCISAPSCKIKKQAIYEHDLKGEIPAGILSPSESIHLSIKVSRKEE